MNDTTLRAMAGEESRFEAQCDCELDSPGVLSHLPIEERLKHWTDWALYLKRRIETHYRPENARLVAAVEELRCCGNCDHHADRIGKCVCESTVAINRNVNAADHCHFTPSRWTARKESDERDQDGEGGKE